MTPFNLLPWYRWLCFPITRYYLEDLGMPRFYGIAYTDYMRDVFWIAPMPLNWFIHRAMELYWYIRHPVELKRRAKFRAELRAAYRLGRQKGWSENAAKTESGWFRMPGTRG